MQKTTEQLAKECGFEFNTGLLMSYAPTHAQMEAFRLAVIRDYFENAVTEAWMLEYQTMGGDTTWKLSWSKSGAGVCNRIQGPSHEIKLYAAPKG